MKSPFLRTIVAELGLESIIGFDRKIKKYECPMHIVKTREGLHSIKVEAMCRRLCKKDFDI
jgi:hypothetical protein